MIRFLAVLMSLSALSLSGCAALSGEHDPYEGWTAKEFYQEAGDALDREDYQSALELFTKLESRYPYGKFAEQAQLESAYAHYKAEEPAAAIAAAERFIKLHPRHDKVDYAYYIRALASYHQGEGLMDRFVPRDKAKRDPQALRQAFRYFKDLVTRFPDSEYRDDSVQHMVHLRELLAEYEIHVANYYMKRSAYLATARRAKYVVESYPRTPSVPIALGLMVRSYRQMGMADLADDAMRVLKENYGDHPVLAELEDSAPPEKTEE